MGIEWGVSCGDKQFVCLIVVALIVGKLPLDRVGGVGKRVLLDSFQMGTIVAFGMSDADNRSAGKQGNVGLRISALSFMSSFSEGLLLNRSTLSSSFHISFIAFSTTGVKVVVITNGNCLMERTLFKRCDGGNVLLANSLFSLV